MSRADKKEVYRLFAASGVLCFILLFGFFGGDGDFASGLKPSVEVGISSMSPRGISGGLIIPASCPSYEHYSGECTPPPSADIKANGSDGPLSIPSGTSVWISWTSANASSCSITKNGSACSITGSTCAELNFPGSAGNSGPLTGGPFSYSINCMGASDVVNISIQAVGACNDDLDNDGDTYIDFDGRVSPPATMDPGCTSPSDNDETNRYACSQGVCSSVEGVGLNSGGCSYGKYQTSARCALTQCNDSIDNDSDGKTDFPFDLGCTSVYDNNESNIPGVFKECDPGLQTCE